MHCKYYTTDLGYPQCTAMKCAPRVYCEDDFNMCECDYGKKMLKDKNQNSVEHPYHYNTGKIEVIDAILDWKLNFCLGNAIKYIARCEHKNNKVEDLKKAIFYLQIEIEQSEEKQSE